MSPGATRQEYVRRLLTEVETGHGTSQRSLARRAGMALGLTNVILKALVERGWVRVAPIDGQLRYEITPEGAAEKTRIATAYFAYTTRVYAEARDRVRERLAHLSHAWEAAGGPKRVAFYGAAEAAEIGYVCLQESDLVVTAVFDDNRRGRFFGAPVRPIDRLARAGEWDAFDKLLVMSFDHHVRSDAETRLLHAGFPAHRVFWL